MHSTRRHLTTFIATAATAAIAAIVTVACGSQAGPAPAPAAAAGAVTSDTFDPTGRYELVAERGSERLVLEASLHRRADGSLAGIVSSPTAPMLTVRTGSVRGRTISMRVVADDGSEARVELVVDGERVTGRLTRDTGDFMRVTGRRLR